MNSRLSLHQRILRQVSQALDNCPNEAEAAELGRRVVANIGPRRAAPTGNRQTQAAQKLKVAVAGLKRAATELKAAKAAAAPPDPGQVMPMPPLEVRR